MINIVVLISGSGSNLQAIMDACQSGMIAGRVVGVLSNKADAYGLVRAQHAGIATTVINHKDFANRDAFDVAMQQHIDVWQPDVVVLAGFMRILTPAFVQCFEGKLVNILVVDDEHGIRDLLWEILNDEGHNVELAENAAQARAARLRERPDLVLLDIWMPDTDGVTLLKEWSSTGALTMRRLTRSG